jgi:hypothetical protein
MARTDLTVTEAGRTAFSDDDEVVRDGDYLAYVVAAQSYRALRRYITRHVVPHADALIRRLLSLAPDQCAQQISDDPRALAAWAVAIWSQDLECEVSSRLWLPRSAPPGRCGMPRAVLDRAAMSMELDVKAPEGLLRQAQADWLLRHATLAVLRHRFARARAVAHGMAQAGDADLGKSMIGRNRLSLAGEADVRTVRFTVQGERTQDVLLPQPHGTKAARRAQRLEHLRQLTRVCVGLCLRYSQRDGWGVATSSAPDAASVAVLKRHRLLVEGRPHFLLFPTTTGWCARMERAPLETLDSEPGGAIACLREAYRRYRTLQVERAEEAAAPEPAVAVGTLVRAEPGAEIPVLGTPAAQSVQPVPGRVLVLSSVDDVTVEGVLAPVHAVCGLLPRGGNRGSTSASARLQTEKPVVRLSALAPRRGTVSWSGQGGLVSAGVSHWAAN